MANQTNGTASTFSVPLYANSCNPSWTPGRDPVFLLAPSFSSSAVQEEPRITPLSFEFHEEGGGGSPGNSAIFDDILFPYSKYGPGPDPRVKSPHVDYSSGHMALNKTPSNFVNGSLTIGNSAENIAARVEPNSKETNGSSSLMSPISATFPFPPFPTQVSSSKHLKPTLESAPVPVGASDLNGANERSTTSDIKSAKHGSLFIKNSTDMEPSCHFKMSWGRTKKKLQLRQRSPGPSDGELSPPPSPPPPPPPPPPRASNDFMEVNLDEIPLPPGSPPPLAAWIEMEPSNNNKMQPFRRSQDMVREYLSVLNILAHEKLNRVEQGVMIKTLAEMVLIMEGQRGNFGKYLKAIFEKFRENDESISELPLLWTYAAILNKMKASSTAPENWFLKAATFFHDVFQRQTIQDNEAAGEMLLLIKHVTMHLSDSDLAIGGVSNMPNRLTKMLTHQVKKLSPSTDIGAMEENASHKTFEDYFPPPVVSAKWKVFREYGYSPCSLFSSTITKLLTSNLKMKVVRRRIFVSICAAAMHLLHDTESVHSFLAFLLEKCEDITLLSSQVMEVLWVVVGISMLPPVATTKEGGFFYKLTQRVLDNLRKKWRCSDKDQIYALTLAAKSTMLCDIDVRSRLDFEHFYPLGKKEKGIRKTFSQRIEELLPLFKRGVNKRKKEERTGIRMYPLLSYDGKKAFVYKFLNYSEDIGDMADLS